MVYSYTHKHTPAVSLFYWSLMCLLFYFQPTSASLSAGVKKLTKLLNLSFKLISKHAGAQECMQQCALNVLIAWPARERGFTPLVHLKIIKCRHGIQQDIFLSEIECIHDAPAKHPVVPANPQWTCEEIAALSR